MQLPRLTVVIDAVPIINTIRGVTVLLDLDQNIAGADCMKSAGRQKNGIAGLDRNSVNEIGHRPCAHSLLEFIAADSVAKSDMKSRAANGRGDIPKLRLWFAAKFRRDFVGRMNLKGKLVVGVEQLDDQWETRRIRRFARDRLPVVGPKLV